MSLGSREYGVGDSSYIMAGKLTGITKLVDEFDTRATWKFVISSGTGI